MFGIGPSELVVILVIALLVLGPKRLPELASALGKGLAEFRRATSDINAELDSARRAIEEETREASKTVAPDKRVSRAERTQPRAAVSPGRPATAKAPPATTSADDQEAPEQDEGENLADTDDTATPDADTARDAKV